jgi:ATP synthase protein I
MHDEPSRRETAAKAARGSPSLEEQRRRLDHDIDAARRHHAEHALEADALVASATSASAMAYGLRLSSAFVGAIVAGAVLGWLIDYAFSTSPWGLITSLCVGFIAGFFNLMRVVNENGPKRSDLT